jgi:hypothetical protein
MNYIKYTAIACSIFSLVACGGGGSNSDTPIVPPNIVPIAVFGTSYENKNSIKFDQTQVPGVRNLEIPKIYSDELDSNERSVTFGDFLQEGKYSAFVSSMRATNKYGIANLPDEPGVAYFLSQDARGVWRDRTSELLKTKADRTTCVSASYSITADFNNDGKPDVYISCSGVDNDFHNFGFSMAELIKIKSSNQILFLSQSNGTYKRTEVPFNIYSHQASAADINGDGNVDIVTINVFGNSIFHDSNSGVDSVSVLLGNGDGTFKQDTTIIPKSASMEDLNVMWNLYLIPIDGRLDLILSKEKFTIWVKGDKKRGFDWGSLKKFVMPYSNSRGTRYSTALDVVYDNGYFYFHVTSEWAEEGVEWAIIKYSTDAVDASVIYKFDNPTVSLKPYTAQIKPAASGTFVAHTGGCWSNAGACLMNVKYK